MNVEFGIKINAKKHILAPLKPTLRGWNKAILAYCKAWKYDHHPYFYNERANISLLAAGAWLSGEIALEEYPTEKKRETGEGRGRCDLMVGAKAKYYFQIESKIRWLMAGFDESKKIAEGFGDAIDSAEKNTESKTRIACLFLPLSFEKKMFPKFKADPVAHVKQELTKLIAYKADLWAWCFPKGARETPFPEKNGSKFFWPGIVIGMQACKGCKI